MEQIIKTNCQAEGGCGRKGIILTPDNFELFFPTPREMRLGAQVFGIVQCPNPDCKLPTRQIVVPQLIGTMIINRFRVIPLPELPEADSAMSDDEILDLYYCLKSISPADLIPTELETV